MSAVVVDDVVVFEVHLRAESELGDLTESELGRFKLAIDRVCREVLEGRGLAPRAHNYEVHVTDMRIEKTEPEK